MSDPITTGLHPPITSIRVDDNGYHTEVHVWTHHHKAGVLVFSSPGRTDVPQEERCGLAEFLALIGIEPS